MENLSWIPCESTHTESKCMSEESTTHALLTLVFRMLMTIGDQDIKIKAFFSLTPPPPPPNPKQHTCNYTIIAHVC